MDRTVSPYQLPDVLGDLATTISGINTDQLSGSLSTLAKTFAHTPPDLRNALQGVARFAQTLDERDAHLRTLLDNAAKATGVLAKRTDQVVSLVKDTNALLGAAADAERGPGPDLDEYLRGVAATAGIHRREPAGAAARHWTSSTGC